MATHVGHRLLSSRPLAVARLATDGVLIEAEALRPGEPKAVRIGIISRRTSEEDGDAVVALLDAAVA